MSKPAHTNPYRSFAAGPFANSYVVPRTGLIAGEYPGSLREPDGHEKIAALLDADVTTFVDLTDDGEMHPYLPLLRELHTGRTTTKHLAHHRLPIPDMGIPTPERMSEILDCIDGALRSGERVYVHCWGGVGRTGTVVGCHLVRHGATPDEALTEVAQLFDTMSDGKRGRHPEGSPQTDAQRDFVRSWSERAAETREGGADPAGGPVTQQAPTGVHATRWPITARPPARDRFLGALVGLAVGDALGTTLEFRPPGTFTPVDDMVGGGPFELEPGQWTDDTSMAMCLAESLLECSGFDAVDQLQRYLRWHDDGHWSSTGVCFDIGNTTRAALERFRLTGDGFSGSTADHEAGNGSLMRLAPVPMYFAADAERAIRMAGDSSRVTHGAPTAVDACRWFAGLLVGALRGDDKAALLGSRYTPVSGLWEREPLHPAVDAVAAGSFLRKRPPEIRGTGFVVDALEAALWAFATTDDFRSGALRAVNLGDDADTTGAIYGQIAGAFYGVEGIPQPWRDRITRSAEIAGVAERLAQRGVASSAASDDSAPAR